MHHQSRRVLSTLTFALNFMLAAFTGTAICAQAPSPELVAHHCSNGMESEVVGKITAWMLAAKP